MATSNGRPPLAENLKVKGCVRAYLIKIFAEIDEVIRHRRDILGITSRGTLVAVMVTTCRRDFTPRVTDVLLYEENIFMKQLAYAPLAFI